VDRLEAEVGATIELTDVLLLSESGRAMVGTPTVADARVVVEVLEHGRDKKILVFKYKNKTRYRRRRGHRQDFTRLAIKQIAIGQVEAAETKPKRASRKKAKPAASETETPEVTAETTAVTIDNAAPAKPRARQARKVAASVEAPPTEASAADGTAVKPEAPEEAAAEE